MNHIPNPRPECCECGQIHGGYQPEPDSPCGHYHDAECPNPAVAGDDPRLHDGNPIIDEAEQALRDLGATDRESARDRLRMLTYHAELSQREIAAVMRRFLAAEIADMIADAFGRPPIDADTELAGEIIARIEGWAR